MKLVIDPKSILLPIAELNTTAIVTVEDVQLTVKQFKKQNKGGKFESILNAEIETN